MALNAAPAGREGEGVSLRWPSTHTRLAAARLVHTVGSEWHGNWENFRAGFHSLPQVTLSLVDGSASSQAWLTLRAMENDRELVARQLGREPRAFRRVAVRCPFGCPAVTEQSPY